jgi:hypothetical protein
MTKQNAVLLIAVFLLGFAGGFELCLVTFVKRAIAIARSAVATSNELLAILKGVQTELKNLFPMQIQERAKPTKRTVH